MVEQEIARLYGQIEQFRSAGDGDHGVQIFQLWGRIQWALQLAGGYAFLEAMENRVLACRVSEGLEQARVEINQMRLSQPNRGEECPPGFPFLELPLLARMNVIRFLDGGDLLSLSTVFPYEDQEWQHLVHQAVISLLLRKGMLNPVDASNLSGVSPRFANCVMKHFQNVKWNSWRYLDEANIWRSTVTHLSLTQLMENPGQHPVVAPVLISLGTEDVATTLTNLTRCGSRILHAVFKQHVGNLTSASLGRCLHLLPNIQTLNLNLLFLDIRLEEDQLPELPSLRNLIVVHSRNVSLQRSLLRKYAAQLELLFIDSQGEPNAGFQLPAGAPRLRSLSYKTTISLLSTPYSARVLQETVNLFNLFAHSPLKKIHASSWHIPLVTLLGVVANTWAHTLEEVYLDLKPVQNQEEQRQSLEIDRITQVRFPYVKRVLLQKFPFWMTYYPLLLFPAMEELVLDGNDTRRDGPHDQNPLVQLYQNRNRMLGSHVWKLFPKLDKMSFCLNVNWEKVTRQECLDYKGDAEGNGEAPNDALISQIRITAHALLQALIRAVNLDAQANDN